MYYNSNKQANDYYNSYKREMQELEAYEKRYKIQKLIKITFLFTLLLLLGLASYYRYFTDNIESTYKTERRTLKKPSYIKPIVISEEELPQSPQLIAYQKEHQENVIDTKESTKEKKITNISKKDIALIVQIIMAQMSNQKEAPLEKQLKAVESTKFIQKDLKDSNHYNKVIINNNRLEANETVQNSELAELTNNMNRILEEEDEGDKVKTKYSTSIEKEVVYRENEMRVIVVKKGDTLSRIAKRAYGNSNDYTKIFSANPEIIKNPDQIYVGMRLRIPS